MRSEVAYGSSSGEPSIDELRDVLVWAARMRRWRHR
jgi:hypothetical protein